MAGFQSIKNGIEAKAGIGPNPNLSDVRGHVAKASLQQFHAAIPGAGIAGTSVITSKAANGSGRPGLRLFYAAASCGGKSVLVRQLRGPAL